MATINFNSTITKVDSSTLTLDNSYYIGLAVKTSHNDHLINTKTSDDYTLPNSYTYAGLIYNITKHYTITSTTAFSTSTFADGVYQATISESYDDGNTYESTAYQLFTYVIDGLISAYPQTTLFEIANLNAIVTLRTSLDVEFEAENYTNCNYIISQIEYLLNASGALDYPSSLTLTNNNTLSVVVSPQTTAPTLSQFNALYNTFNTVELNAYQYNATYCTPVIGGSTSVESLDLYLDIYSDGVWKNFIYVASADAFYAEPFIMPSYNIVTTTIDAEFATFEANYNPNNAAQLASYTAMLAAYAEIATLSNDIVTNYAAINAQIAIIQANLALWVEVDMSLVLTNKSTMTLTINSTLPNVVYSARSLTLDNTNDESQEYTITTFPETYIDLTKTFSSSTINFGSQYEDAVYKVNLSWTADNGMEFSGVAYCLVMTQINCGIAQVIAGRPECKQVQAKLDYLMTFRDMAIDAYVNTDYGTCNFYINKCIVILNQSGCGCGCN